MIFGTTLFLRFFLSHQRCSVNMMEVECSNHVFHNQRSPCSSSSRHNAKLFRGDLDRQASFLLETLECTRMRNLESGKTTCALNHQRPSKSLRMPIRLEPTVETAGWLTRPRNRGLMARNREKSRTQDQKRSSENNRQCENLDRDTTAGLNGGLGESCPIKSAPLSSVPRSEGYISRLNPIAVTE